MDLAFIVEISNFFITMFLVIIAYFIFTEAKQKGYKIDFMYFLVAAIGFMLFDLAYIMMGEMDVISSLRYFVKSSFLGLILLVFMVKSHFLTDNLQRARKKPKPVLKKQ